MSLLYSVKTGRAVAKKDSETRQLVQAPAVLPPLEEGDPQLARRIAQLERHMRENKLRQHTSFVDCLGSVDDPGDEVRSSKEAKRLAFDIFWNVRTDYSRLISPPPNIASSFFSPSRQGGPRSSVCALQHLVYWELILQKEPEI